MRGQRMRFLGRTGVILETERNSEELSFQWQICNFFSLSGKGGDYYSSPLFDFTGACWSLKMYSNGLTKKSASGYTGLFLERKDTGPHDKTIQFTLCITGAEGVEKRGEDKKLFSRSYSSYGWSEFLPRDMLKDHHSILMPDGLLTVECTMKIVVTSPARGVPSYQDTSSQTDSEFEESRACTGGSQSVSKQDASIQTNEEFKEAKALSNSSEKQGCEKVVEDIAKLLASGEDSDVAVQVGDVEFKVHRAILAARCPVLASMFRHETAERASNRISICDCEHEVFRQYLHFIYTGSVEPLSEKNCFRALPGSG